MLVVMGTMLLAILVAGTAAMTGNPLHLIAAGVLLAAAFLLLARRGGGRGPARHNR